MHKQFAVYFLPLLIFLLGCGPQNNVTKEESIARFDNVNSTNSTLALVDKDDSSNILSVPILSNKTYIGVAVTVNEIGSNTAVNYSVETDVPVALSVDNTTGKVFAEEANVGYLTQLNDFTITVTAIVNENTEASVSNTFAVIVDINSNNDLPLARDTITLLDWNNGQGKYFPGWQWSDDVAYGNPGWVMADSGPFGGRESFKWGDGARSFNKRDNDKNNEALIDVFDVAPSTKGGGSLLVKETEDNTDHFSKWWIWYDGKPLSERQVTDQHTDRMSFYLKVEGLTPLMLDDGTLQFADNFHIGTYLCWHGDKPAYGTGDGCPYEGVGNQHYYHYLAIEPGAWVHVLLDQHPQHLRGVKETLSNNPVYNIEGKNYFAQLHQFYFETTGQQKNLTQYHVDEISFFSTRDTDTILQNEDSITSLWVGYWPDIDTWQIGFQDESFSEAEKGQFSTFEVRWSLQPITNENYAQANIVEPLLFSGVTYTGEVTPIFRRVSRWRKNAWTKFKLPDDIENNYTKIFFAVKDVSKQTLHTGTKWPYNIGDGHDAASKYIKVIDYYLRKP